MFRAIRANISVTRFIRVRFIRAIMFIHNNPNKLNNPNSSNNPNKLNNPNSSNNPNKLNNPNSSNKPNKLNNPNSPNNPNKCNNPNRSNNPNNLITVIDVITLTNVITPVLLS
jgi:hypothetical protein